MVLDSIRSHLPDESVFFWRDKSGREIDFVIKRAGREAMAIKCKIDPDRFKVDSIKTFRSHYKKGRNIVISPWIRKAYRRKIDGELIEFYSLQGWISENGGMPVKK